MTTLAAWLFVALGVLFVAMIAVVVLSVRSLVRKQRRLAGEVQGLQHDLDAAVGSVQEHHGDARPAHRHRRTNGTGRGAK